MIKTGLIISAVLLVLIAIFGPGIRSGYLSARNKMRAATERRRLSKSRPHE
jgi:F0F1-type ATP synthase membrane subunit c/vacuolar-type H+-ATPase subunit K